MLPIIKQKEMKKAGDREKSYASNLKALDYFTIKTKYRDTLKKLAFYLKQNICFWIKSWFRQ